MGDVVLSAPALVVIGALLTAMSGAIGFLFRTLMSVKDSQLETMKSERDSYKEIADDAVGTLEAKVNLDRQAKDEPPFKVVVPVVPEHNSPVTQKQKDAAHLATLRARFTAVTKALGFPPRV